MALFLSAKDELDEDDEDVDRDERDWKRGFFEGGEEKEREGEKVRGFWSASFVGVSCFFPSHERKKKRCPNLGGTSPRAETRRPASA